MSETDDPLRQFLARRDIKTKPDQRDLSDLEHVLHQCNRDPALIDLARLWSDLRHIADRYWLFEQAKGGVGHHIADLAQIHGRAAHLAQLMRRASPEVLDLLRSGFPTQYPNDFAATPEGREAGAAVGDNPSYEGLQAGLAQAQASASAAIDLLRQRSAALGGKLPKDPKRWMIRELRAFAKERFDIVERRRPSLRRAKTRDPDEDAGGEAQGALVNFIDGVAKMFGIDTTRDSILTTIYSRRQSP